MRRTKVVDELVSYTYHEKEEELTGGVRMEEEQKKIDKKAEKSKTPGSEETKEAGQAEWGDIRRRGRGKRRRRISGSFRDDRDRGDLACDSGASDQMGRRRLRFYGYDTDSEERALCK